MMMMALTTETATQTSTPPSSPAPLPFERDSSAIAPSHQAPRSGTVVPNRIFVGGIDSKTSERDLAQLFSQHGAVTEVKIILTRTGMSKGRYGFVTFETEEDANKMLDDPNRFYINDKKLNISQAVLKHRVSVRVSRNVVQEPSHVMPAPSASSYHITPSGHPYTYHNGTAYFPSSNVNPTTHYWPSASGTAMMPPPQPQPIWQQQTYHQYQTPVPPGPEGMDQATNGGIIQPLMPFAGASIPEQFVEPLGQPYYHHHVYTQSQVYTHGGPIVSPQEPEKEPLFFPMHQGFPAPVYWKPRFSRSGRR